MPSFAPPNFELGVDLTQVSLTGWSLVSGAWTVGSTFNVLAYTDELAHTIEEEAEDVRPVWDLQMNDLRTGFGNALRIVTLKTSAAANALNTIVNTYPIVNVAYTMGKEVFTGFYRVGRYEGGVRGRGGQRLTLDLRPINSGGAQVAYTVNP
jgi:hypothetical protein